MPLLDFDGLLVLLSAFAEPLFFLARLDWSFDGGARNCHSQSMMLERDSTGTDGSRGAIMSGHDGARSSRVHGGFHQGKCQ